MRVNLRRLTKEVQRVLTRSFEGIDQLDGVGEGKTEDVIDMAVETPPSSPKSGQPLQPPPTPKTKARECASASGTAR